MLSKNSVLVVRFVDGGFVERRRPEVAEVSECGCTLAVVTLGVPTHILDDLAYATWTLRCATIHSFFLSKSLT